MNETKISTLNAPKNIELTPWRVSIIWCSCLDKPRSIAEIRAAWEYESTALYSGRIAEKMQEQKLLKFDRFANKQAYYSSIFEGYWDFMGEERLRLVGGHLFDMLKHDWPIWIKFFKEPKVRESFFNLEAIRALFPEREKVMQNGMDSLPSMALNGAILFYVSNKEKVPSSMFKQKVAPFLMSMQSSSVGINPASYWAVVLNKIRIEDMAEYKYIEKAELTKFVEKQVGPVIKSVNKVMLERANLIVLTKQTRAIKWMLAHVSSKRCLRNTIDARQSSQFLPQINLWVSLA